MISNTANAEQENEILRDHLKTMVGFHERIVSRLGEAVSLGLRKDTVSREAVIAADAVANMPDGEWDNACQFGIDHISWDIRKRIEEAYEYLHELEKE